MRKVSDILRFTMRIGILSAQLGEEDVHENRRLVREIRLAGHRARIINYRNAVITATKNKSVLYQLDRNGLLKPVKIDAVIPRINEADGKSINLATLALECLIANGVYSTAPPSAIRLSKDKIRSQLVITGAGIPTPRTAAITSPHTSEIDLDKVLKIVEPNNSNRLVVKTNIGTHGKGVMSANTRGEARAIVEGFLANNIPVLLQQFVEPTKKDQYVDLRFIVVGGKVVSSMKRVSTRKDEIRANLSLGGVGLMYDASPEEIEIAERAAKAVGLSIAGVDVIPSGKSRLVIEINSSPGFIIEKVTGVNIARKIARQAVNNATRHEKRAMQKLTDKLNEPITIRSFEPLGKAVKPSRIAKIILPEKDRK
jgi:ribosomal protein S6--L-glutamate ligase